MSAMPAMPRAVSKNMAMMVPRMKTLQLEPTSITWNSLMSASASARHWRSALAMLPGRPVLGRVGCLKSGKFFWWAVVEADKE